MNLLNPREHSRKGNSIVNSWYTGRSGSRNFVELTIAQCRIDTLLPLRQKGIYHAGYGCDQRVIDTLGNLQRELNAVVWLIDHNMDLFAQFSVSIGVLYASKPRSRY